MSYNHFYLGEMIKNYRHSQGLSQKNFAEKIGLSEKLIRKIEHGSGKGIHSETLNIIFKFFDVDFITFSKSDDSLEYQRNILVARFNAYLATCDQNYVQAVEYNMDLFFQIVEQFVTTPEK